MKCFLILDDYKDKNYKIASSIKMMLLLNNQQLQNLNLLNIPLLNN